MITKVSIRPGCISCKNCERTCPNIFRVEGTSWVVNSDYQTNGAAIYEAARNCPVQVIAVEDNDPARPTATQQEIQAFFVEKRQKARGVLEFDFRTETEGTFTPGQFASLHLQDAAGEFARCYSIRSWRNGIIRFCIKMLPNGRGSAVLQSLAKDVHITLQAGLGSFCLEQTSRPKLYIATGTGIAPIMAMIEATPANIPCHVLFGGATKDDILYAEELRAYPAVTTTICLSKETMSMPGVVQGRVTDALKKMDDHLTTKADIYVCGNPRMVDDVRAILRAQGVPEERIHYEHFVSAAPADSLAHLASSRETGASDGEIALRFLLPWFQRLLLIASALTPMLALVPERTAFLWDLSLYAVILLMILRPLRDIFPKNRLFPRLIPLRKELGIFSASVVAASALIHYTSLGFDFLGTYFQAAYWSFEKNQFAAHMGELTGVILLLTSNTLSQKLLGPNWKRLQRLSYVYFFSGAWYVWASFGKTAGLVGMILVLTLSLLAFALNRLRPTHA
ncbi:hypothetical protein COW46_00970 [Candidatus Gracilibacteria bacterium CG17_big_fil_post_rev_8_21_14_2_50_48_13]|nr:MAG: hypothetical protein COW46_00970 [Candidatus Gracilibacteria bacterium CG17_big_fil_post_rev_8_21_14_2_50_48_13]